jgi:hypothetical protein
VFPLRYEVNLYILFDKIQSLKDSNFRSSGEFSLSRAKVPYIARTFPSPIS